MALDDIVRNAVALANTITAPLQTNVSFFAWTGQDGFGKHSYATVQTLPAIIEHKQRLRTMSSGRMIMTEAKITLLSLPAVNGAADRTEPIDPRDKFVLLSGTTGPIVDIEGLVDPDTNSPYLAEVWLGISPL